MTRVNVCVQVENTGLKRADRLVEGDIILRRDYVAIVTRAEFSDDHREVKLNLRFPHADRATGMEFFWCLRDQMFPTIGVRTF